MLTSYTKHIDWRYIMADIFDRKVVQSNDIIQGVTKMDIVPLKIFEMAVSLINPLDPPKNGIVLLSKKELFDFFNVSSDSKYTRFKDAIKELQEKSVILIRSQDKRKGNSFESIVPIPYVKWTDFEDVIELQFNEKIMPYLIHLKENFTQYLLTDIGMLNGKYSIILYKWLTMNYNQYKKYGRFDLKNPNIEMKELRQITDTENDYIRFDNFERRVLRESIDDINLKTHYSIKYEKIKRGRRISGIRFNIEEKKRSINPKYLYQKDLAYEERREDHINERIKKLELLPLALADIYVSYLIRHDLLNLNNSDEIVEAYEVLSPLYEKMMSDSAANRFQPYDNFEKHIEYIKEHMVDTSIKYRNIVEYLRVAAEGHIGKLEYQNRKRDENI